MTIEAKGKKFIVDDYFEKMTELEIIELKESIEECNWNNFDEVDTLYFASGSQTATYDFMVKQQDGNIFLTQCEEGEY
jgi:hypothetical protein